MNAIASTARSLDYSIPRTGAKACRTGSLQCPTRLSNQSLVARRHCREVHLRTSTWEECDRQPESAANNGDNLGTVVLEFGQLHCLLKYIQFHVAEANFGFAAAVKLERNDAAGSSLRIFEVDAELSVNERADAMTLGDDFVLIPIVQPDVLLAGLVP